MKKTGDSNFVYSFASVNNAAGSNNSLNFSKSMRWFSEGLLLQKSGQLAPEYSVLNKNLNSRSHSSEVECDFDQSFDFPEISALALFFRRAFDFLFAAMALVFLSPVFLLIALLIKIQSPGAPVIFTQKRLGLNGKFFKLYKFRTMVPGAEQILAEWLETRPEVKEEYFTYRKLKNDPRIIPGIGEFIRKTSLDELPQFFNVLVGDMAVVGPRPYIKEEFHQHPAKVVDYITSVKPGVTGYWQTRDRHANTFDYRVKQDIKYLEIRSFSLDLQLIVDTITAMVFKTGA